MNPLPETPEALIATLTEALAAQGFPVTPPPAPAQTEEEAAHALFFLAGHTGALFFNVWSEEGDEVPVAGVSVFLPTPGTPKENLPLLGNDETVVRQRFEPALFQPLTAALSALSRRGFEPGRPNRGEVAFPRDAADPDIRFLVEFQDTSRGPQAMAIARTREARALFPALSELPLSAPEAAFLAERLWKVDTLFQGRPIVFTGSVDAGRETSFLSAMAAVPGDLNSMALVERARPYDPRMGARLVGGEHSPSQMIRAFLRQDPDLIFIELVRTNEELEVTLQGALTGHGMLYGTEESPEEAMARMETVLQGLPQAPLFVHHTRDAASGARSAALYVKDPHGPPDAPRVIRWSPGN